MSYPITYVSGYSAAVDQRIVELKAETDSSRKAKVSV
jgi:hypothetical protein